ncbi:MAG: response regulator transcription factor [Firmicutes bacterium]|nr:response regulator transcription factor [Bacillota bacterium]
MNEAILIIEDDPGIQRIIALELLHNGYKPALCADGREGLKLALDNNYDLIILDIMLPTLNGVEVLRRLRADKSTPVIILTARDRIMDKVSGLDLGASDYMTKPFAIEELLARVRANLRKPVTGNTMLSHGRLKVDVGARAAAVDDTSVELTKKEFDLLVYLLQNKGKVLGRELIVESVWGFEFYGNTNLVDVYIRYLRAKIEDVFGIKIIKTVRGSGYMIV